MIQVNAAENEQRGDTMWFHLIWSSKNRENKSVLIKQKSDYHPSENSFTSGFPHGLAVKDPPASGRDTGDSGLIPGLGRCPGGGNGNPLQYSYLENPLGRGA